MKGGLLLIFLLASLNAKDWIGSGSLTLTFFDVKEWNTLFERHNIRQFSTPQKFWGSGFARFKKGLAPAIWMFHDIDWIRTDSLEIWMDYTTGFWEERYSLPITQSLIPFLSLGFGGYYWRFDFIPTSLSEVDFDSLLTGASARRTSSILDMGISLSIGSGFCFIIPFKKYFVGLGVKGGYLFSPLHTDWRLRDGKPLRGAPELGLNSPYLSLGFVFGRREIGKE